MNELQQVYKSLQPPEPAIIPKVMHNCSACKKKAKYQCPKCNEWLCTLQCYKGHNVKCTEEFAKSQTIANMKANKASPADIKSMKKILYEQYNSQNEIDSEEPFDKTREEYLLEEIEKGNITCLDPQEQKEFSKYLKGITHFNDSFDEWTPYWEEEPINIGIQEVCAVKDKLVNQNINFTDEEEYESVLLAKISVLPKFSCIAKKPPSLSILSHLKFIITPFVFFQRVYNGDIEFDCQYIAAVCTRLLLDHPTECTSDGLEYLNAYECEQVKLYSDKVRDDVNKIMAVPVHILSTLFRIYDLMEDGGIKQKLIYFASYVKSK